MIGTDALRYKGGAPDQSCQNRKNILTNAVDFHGIALSVSLKAFVTDGKAALLLIDKSL